MIFATDRKKKKTRLKIGLQVLGGSVLGMDMGGVGCFREIVRLVKDDIIWPDSCKISREEFL